MNNPIETFQQIPVNAKHVCLLHSANKSILAYNPDEIFSSNDDLEGMKRFIKKHSQHQIIGYCSYDLGVKLHHINSQAINDLKLPNIYFMAFKDWQEWEKPDMNFKIHDNNKYSSNNFKTTISKEEYNKSYKKIKNYIKEGDVYQINLTHRLEGSTDMPARTLFCKITKENPVEFLAYIEGEGFEILSASPERFIKISKGKIETCPIKGTRPRGKTKEEDERLKKDLLESEKEAAELNMITDLLRNDIGKIAKKGTVKVEGHRLIQKCPTVWHTYSRITGEIKTTPIDALISMLPGGSITGCPKKRAIEIIDELETNCRSVYTGAIGHIEPSGDLDFNIAIRTIIKKGKKLYLQVGGGIVIDSKEKAEFEETLQKAKSFMEILC